MGFLHGALQGARFKSSNLTGAGFVDCDLRGANLDDALFSHTIFNACAMAGVTGRPRVEGLYIVGGADLSDSRDGSNIAAEEIFHNRWGRPAKGE